jgi:hypothetical protein
MLNILRKIAFSKNILMILFLFLALFSEFSKRTSHHTKCNIDTTMARFFLNQQNFLCCRYSRCGRKLWPYLRNNNNTETFKLSQCYCWCKAGTSYYFMPRDQRGLFLCLCEHSVITQKRTSWPTFHRSLLSPSST